VTPRGGQQRIPRPDTARHGDPPPWHRLGEDERHLTLAAVRRRCASLPIPVQPPHPAGSRAAAVLVPIFERDGEAHVVLTKRPETMPSHRGEIAFPGGKVQPESDATLRDAALREAEEEIGLRPTDVDIVAELPALATVASQFSITPFVGLVTHVPALVANPAEVVSIIEVPIAELLHDEVFREERWFFGEMDRPMYFYELHGETVWGATARILTDLLTALTERTEPTDRG